MPQHQRVCRRVREGRAWQSKREEQLAGLDEQQREAVVAMDPDDDRPLAYVLGVQQFFQLEFEATSPPLHWLALVLAHRLAH